MPGIFAAGNVVHVYDLVDWVTEAGLVAGKRAALYAHSPTLVATQTQSKVPTYPGDNVRYVVPHRVDPETLQTDTVMLQMRVTQPLEQPVRVTVRDENKVITQRSLRYARPGEMVSITLRGQQYDHVRSANELRVHIIPR